MENPSRTRYYRLHERALRRMGLLRRPVARAAAIRSALRLWQRGRPIARSWTFRMIAGLLIVGACMASLAFHQPRWVIGVLQKLVPVVIWRGSDESNVVALTFDDGPDPIYTPKILEILRRYKAKATFFLTGTNAARYPELIRQIRIEGHGLGNHLHEDRFVLFASESDLERWLLETESRIGFTEGPKFVRPPRMLFSRRFVRVAQRHGYRIVLGSGYVSDPYRPPVSLIEWSMKRMLHPGAILVLHDAGGNRTRTVSALPSILEAGTSQGLRFVTLETLAGR